MKHSEEEHVCTKACHEVTSGYREALMCFSAQILFMTGHVGPMDVYVALRVLCDGLERKGKPEFKEALAELDIRPYLEAHRHAAGSA